jgi:hypothetical protein
MNGDVARHSKGKRRSDLYIANDLVPLISKKCAVWSAGIWESLQVLKVQVFDHRLAVQAIEGSARRRGGLLEQELLITHPFTALADGRIYDHTISPSGQSPQSPQSFRRTCKIDHSSRFKSLHAPRAHSCALHTQQLNEVTAQPSLQSMLWQC